ncbi:MAG: hypothetical protein ILO53_08740 [Clostridia bacterium]|nr:hypothetical protein [Clostridia bacterium]
MRTPEIYPEMWKYEIYPATWTLEISPENAREKRGNIKPVDFEGRLGYIKTVIGQCLGRGAFAYREVLWKRLRGSGIRGIKGSGFAGGSFTGFA